MKKPIIYQVFESFEDNAAKKLQLASACPMAQSRNLVPIWLENPVVSGQIACNATR